MEVFMLLESKYLNQKLDVATIEKEENGHILQIITHDSLRDIFLNQIAGVIAEYQVISSDRHHSVVLCRIFNDKGRSITEIGESLPATLADPISQNYPTLMAFQRAFDRALIAFLNFEGKVLSNLEMNMGDSEIISASDKSDTHPDTSFQEASVTENTYGEDIVSEDEGPVIMSNPIDSPASDESQPSDKASEEDWGEKLIRWGKYAKNPTKAKDIVIPENKSWLDWVINSYKPANSEGAHAQEILRKVNEVKKIV